MKSKLITLRIDPEMERFYRQAARHILGEDNLAEFLRRGGMAFIREHHGGIEDEWTFAVPNGCVENAYVKHTGRRVLVFRRPYQKKKWRRYA